MSLEKVVCFESLEGHEYIVKFDIFNISELNVSVPIINITLVLVNEKEKSCTIHALNKLTSIVLEYLESNNVILYYYCDSYPIKMRIRQNELSPQKFRSQIFKMLFQRCNSDSYILQNIEIRDNENGNHYISLISSSKNKADLLYLKNIGLENSKPLES